MMDIIDNLRGKVDENSKLKAMFKAIGKELKKRGELPKGKGGIKGKGGKKPPKKKSDFFHASDEVHDEVHDGEYDDPFDGLFDEE
jgi:hypothetical protein